MTKADPLYACVSLYARVGVKTSRQYPVNDQSILTQIQSAALGSVPTSSGFFVAERMLLNLLQADALPNLSQVQRPQRESAMIC